METILLLCILGLFFPSSADSWFHSQLGKMEPANPVVEEGGTLVLNCTILDTYNGPYNASDISFHGGGDHFNGTNVHVLSPATAQLVLANITIEQYGDKMFTCGVPDEKTLGHQAVAVGRRPLVPVITGCVVHNWQKMVCSWTPTRQEQIRHHKLYPKIGYAHARLLWNTVFNTSVWSECPNANDDNCTWLVRDGADSLMLDMTYYVQVEVKNHLGKVHSTIQQFNTSAIVKPAVVTGLRTRQLNWTSVVVSWMPPAPDKQLLVELELTTDAGIHDKRWEVMVTTTELEANFTVDVAPNTGCSLAVKTRPTEGGFWSEPATVRFSTQPTVPGANPEVTSSSFEIGDVCGKDCRQITLHWKKIDRLVEYGPALQYDIKYKCAHSRLPWKHEIVSGNLSQYTIEGCVSVDVVAYITAFNSQGPCRLEPTRIVISQQTNVLPPVDNFVVTSMNGSLINTRWQHVDETTDTLPSYTLYWCEGIVSSSRCTGHLDWLTAPPNRTEFNISLPEGSSFDDYLFGIAVSTDDSTSGITLSDCLYTVNGIAAAPKRVRFAAHQQHSSLSVEWDTPSCHDRHGYITSYVIYYCIIDDDRDCVGVEENVTVTGAAQTHTLTELEGGRTYRVRMASRTAAGYSHASSKSIYQLTTSPGAGLSRTAIAAIVVTVIIADIFLIIGVVTLFMRCCKLRHWYTSGLSIKLPALNERRRSLQMSTASDAPLAGYARWEYQKQPSFSIRSGDSGTGSLSTDDTTPTYSENEISFYSHAAGGMQSSPLMSGKPPTIGEEVEDEVFMCEGLSSPPGAMAGGDTYVRVGANGGVVGGSDLDNTLLERSGPSGDSRVPGGNLSYYNSGSENCYAFIGGFKTPPPVDEVDNSSCSGLGDSIVSEHGVDAQDSREQSANKQTVASPPVGGYVSVDATGAVVSASSDTTPDHATGNDDNVANGWFGNSGGKYEHIPLVEEVGGDSSRLQPANDSPQVAAGYVTVDNNGRLMATQPEGSEAAVPSNNGYVTVDGSGHVTVPETFSPGGGVTNSGCGDARSRDNSIDDVAALTQTRAGVESRDPDSSGGVPRLQHNCDMPVPNSNGYVAINADMFTH